MTKSKLIKLATAKFDKIPSKLTFKQVIFHCHNTLRIEDQPLADLTDDADDVAFKIARAVVNGEEDAEIASALG